MKISNDKKATAISYFLSFIGVIIAGSIGSHIIGEEYAPMVYTVGGICLEKVANLVKEKIKDKV